MGIESALQNSSIQLAVSSRPASAEQVVAEADVGCGVAVAAAGEPIQVVVAQADHLAAAPAQADHVAVGVVAGFFVIGAGVGADVGRLRVVQAAAPVKAVLFEAADRNLRLFL